MFLKLEKLVKILTTMNGVGSRSARKIALELIKDKHNLMLNLSNILRDIHENLSVCEQCYNLDINDICYICVDQSRTKNILCIVENIEDLWAIERSNTFNGIYHVLGGCLSGLLGGKNPEELNIKKVVQRVKNDNIKEVIIATNLTIDGRTTGYYIADVLRDLPVEITGLAYGIPVGGEINYLDESTLEYAFSGRKRYE